MASGFTSGLKTCTCAVIVSSRNKERVEEAVKQLQAQAITCTGVVCHVGSKEHRDRLIATALKVTLGFFFLPLLLSFPVL
jgi:short-subunit dehydrogenase involved in D-alanine esterification of teichoic acids